MSRVFLIDTDTASDDAVALVMALKNSAINVAAITVVAGNVGVEQACRNALYTAELCSSHVSVFAGADGPLKRPFEDATWFHGRDGMGDHGYAPPRRSIEQLPAAEAIIETAEKHPGLVLVTLGPLTNIAQALQRKPDLGKRINRCVVMGGAPCCEGNVTPAAEYNVWCDPEAAHIVLHSRLPVELIGWHLCRGDAAIGEQDIADILALDTPLARFAIECNSTARQAYWTQTRQHGISLPDPIAMAIALDPTVGTEWSEHYVDVETASALTRGMTVVDRLNVARDKRNSPIWRDLIQHPPNAKVCWTLDVPRWKQSLLAALSQT